MSLHRLRTATAILATLLTTPGCKSIQPAVPKGGGAFEDVVFQVGLQQGSVAFRDSRNNTRVIVTDTGAVSLGATTDEFGIAGISGKNEDYSGAIAELKFSSEIYGKEIYRSEISTDVSLAGAGQEASANVIVNRYTVIYEWSRYGSIPAAENKAFTVVRGDFGFAVRLVLDVEIRQTDATAGLDIGPGSLDAALALGIATVSAKYQAVGTTVSFLPGGDIDIRSAEDLAQTTSEFHAAGRRLERKLAECGELVAFDESGAQIPALSPSPPYCKTIADPQMLAYVSMGEGMGDSLLEYQRVGAECATYRTNLQQLVLKKARQKNAKLSGSDWKRHNYLKSRLEDCQGRLQKTTEKAKATRDRAQPTARGEKSAVKAKSPATPKPATQSKLPVVPEPPPN